MARPKPALLRRLFAGLSRARCEDPVEAANRMRWQSDTRGRYEVWYLTTNHRESGVGFWIRYTLEAPDRGHGNPYAQVWFAALDPVNPGANVAIHRSFPIAAMHSGRAPFSLSIGESELRSDSARGRLVCGEQELRWNLHWTPARSVHHHLPRLLYRRGGLAETTVLSPNLRVPLSGSIVVGDRRFEFEGESCGQTHLWGRRHAHSWAWGHCSEFVGAERATLECLSVRLLRGGRLLPPMTMLTLYLDGEVHHFNTLRQILSRRTTEMIRSGRFAFVARRRDLRLSGEFSCRPEHMINAPYADPDGTPSFCAHTVVGDLDLVVERRDGRRWVLQRKLQARGRAHFEIGSRERDPAIAREHQAMHGPREH